MARANRCRIFRLPRRTDQQPGAERVSIPRTRSLASAVMSAQPKSKSAMDANDETGRRVPPPAANPASLAECALRRQTPEVGAGARQAAINRKLLLQYSLRVDPTKRHYPVPLQRGAGDNPFLEPRARHRVYPWLPTRARPVTQSLNAVLFIAVMPFVSGRPAQPGQPRRFLVLHPLEQVRDHQNPLADTPALASCQTPQLGRPIPQTWCACLRTLPHLGITGSRY